MYNHTASQFQHCLNAVELARCSDQRSWMAGWMDDSTRCQSTEMTGVLAQDFFSKDCFKGHPKPYADFMEWRKKEDEMIEAERQKLIPGM